MGDNVCMSYADRDSVLRSIGYASYSEYLASETWRAIRSRDLNRLPNCTFCGKRAECVHHRKYSEAVLRGESDFWLSPLCFDCHTEIEFDENGLKRMRVDVEAEYRRRMSVHEDKVAIAVPASVANRTKCLTCGQWAKGGGNYCRNHLRKRDRESYERLGNDIQCCRKKHRKR